MNQVRVSLLLQDNYAKPITTALLHPKKNYCTTLIEMQPVCLILHFNKLWPLKGHRSVEPY